MEVPSIHPQLANAYKKTACLPIHNRLLLAVLQPLNNLVMAGKSTSFEGVDFELIPGRNGPMRLYRPTRNVSGAGLLWIHGGGYIIGSPAINDRECASIAADLGITVLSVSYRLAPQHPFPAAADDCLHGWQTLLDFAGKWGVDSRRIAIAGQSAGGGLTAGLAQRILDGGKQQPAAQVLMYPMLDDRTATRRELDAGKYKLWRNANNRGAWAHYLGQPAGEADTPAYSVPARRQDLAGLPPTWIGVGECDLFFEEDCLYATRLQEAGIDTELHLASQAPHAFDIIAPQAPIAQDFIASYRQFLGRHLGLAGV